MQLVRERASHVQRLQKTLEDANIKLRSVLTQIMGVSGRAIPRALIDGEHDPDKLLRGCDFLSARRFNISKTPR